MLNARTITCSICCPAREVYRYASNPANLPLWARSFCLAARESEKGWEMETPSGWIGIQFVSTNAFGVLDHTVTLPDGQTVFNTMRVVPNADGSEMLFTLLQRPGSSNDEFNNDAKMVEADFLTLKHLLETPSPSTDREREI